MKERKKYREKSKWEFVEKREKEIVKKWEIHIAIFGKIW